MNLVGFDHCSLMIVQFNVQIVSRQNNIMNWISVAAVSHFTHVTWIAGLVDKIVSKCSVFKSYSMLPTSFTFPAFPLVNSTVWCCHVIVLYCIVHPSTIQMSYPFSSSDAQILVWDDHIIASKWNSQLKAALQRGTWTAAGGWQISVLTSV